jgi:hypothetical protein
MGIDNFFSTVVVVHQGNSKPADELSRRLCQRHEQDAFGD